MIPAFHHCLSVGDADTETTSKTIAEFLATVRGVNKAIELLNLGHETALVDCATCRVNHEAIEAIIEAAPCTDHIAWVLQVEGTAMIAALSSILGGKFSVPENLCMAIRPPKDLTSEQLVMEAFAKCPAKHKALILNGDAMPDFARWKNAGANWIILTPGVAPDVRERIQRQCFTAILPLLELGFKNSDPQFKSHPFPKNWDVDFARDGIPTGPNGAVAEAEARAQVERFQNLDSHVRHGIKESVAAGFSLLEIHDDELWRSGGFNSWNSYCESLLEASRSHVNRLIAHARITEEIRSCDPPTRDNGILVLPANESQSRPLKKLKSAKIRAKAWRLAVKSAAGAMPTARMVADAVGTLSDTKTASKSEEKMESKCRRFIEGLRAAAESCGEKARVLGLLEELENALISHKPTNQ